MWTDAAFVDPYLVARQLPHNQVADATWRGKNLITRAAQGMPHRLDRIGFLWAATRAAHQKECTFELSKMLEELRAFGLRWSPAYAVACLQRIAYTIIELAPYAPEVSTADLSLVISFERFELSQGRRIGHVRFGGLFERAGLIPIRAQIVRGLIRSIPALDLYLWEVTTAWKNRAELPLEIPIDNILADLPDSVSQRRAARYRIRQKHQRIANLWPECPHEARNDVLILKPGGFDHGYRLSA